MDGDRRTRWTNHDGPGISGQNMAMSHLVRLQKPMMMLWYGLYEETQSRTQLHSTFNSHLIWKSSKEDKAEKRAVRTRQC